MPERLTQQQLADDYSVSLSTLKRALRSGVDVHNKQAFVDWVYSNKKRPPGWENGVPWEQGEEQAEAIALSPELHELAEQVRNAPNYDVARTCKTKIDALMQVAKIAVLKEAIFTLMKLWMLFTEWDRPLVQPTNKPKQIYLPCVKVYQQHKRK